MRESNVVRLIVGGGATIDASWAEGFDLPERGGRLAEDGRTEAVELPLPMRPPAVLHPLAGSCSSAHIDGAVAASSEVFIDFDSYRL